MTDFKGTALYQPPETWDGECDKVDSKTLRNPSQADVQYMPWVHHSSNYSRITFSGIGERIIHALVLRYGIYLTPKLQSYLHTKPEITALRQAFMLVVNSNS